MNRDHYQLGDQEFKSKFEDCSLNPVLFTHEAHLRLAWIHIRDHGVDQAVKNICEQIKMFDQTYGDGTKYHKTVTVAAVKMVNHFIQKSTETNFKDFINNFPRLRENFKDLLGSHYSYDVFSFEKAINEYIEPDIQPYDE